MTVMVGWFSDILENLAINIFMLILPSGWGQPGSLRNQHTATVITQEWKYDEHTFFSQA
jgi:hypothetical protein